MAAGWAALPEELLFRVSQSCDSLWLRQVCRQWAAAFAKRIAAANLSRAAAASDILGRECSLADLPRLAVFRGLKKLDLSGLPGSKQCLESVAAVRGLERLTIGTVCEVDGRLQSLAALSALTHLGVSIARSSLAAGLLSDVLAGLPQLRSLTMACTEVHSEAANGLGLMGLQGYSLQSFSLEGSMGLATADLKALEPLHLRELRAQLYNVAAFCTLTALTSLKSLTVADWTPGPLGGARVAPNLEQFSQLPGLTHLSVTHTFGAYNIIELSGLAELTQLRELELCLPATLEDTEQLSSLDSLQAKVALSAAFDESFDAYDQMTCVTRLCFQEILPAVQDGDIDAHGVASEVCLGAFSSLTALASLSFVQGAGQVCGLSMQELADFGHLTSLLFQAGDMGTPWSAQLPQLWSTGLAVLTGLQELFLVGCQNLEQLDLVQLNHLTTLCLENCPLLTLHGLHGLRQLRTASFSHSARLVQHSWQELGTLTHIRRLCLQACGVRDDALHVLLRLTCLKALDLRDTHVTRPRLAALSALPYLTSLHHSTDI